MDKVGVGATADPATTEGTTMMKRSACRNRRYAIPCYAGCEIGGQTASMVFRQRYLPDHNQAGLSRWRRHLATYQREARPIWTPISWQADAERTSKSARRINCGSYAVPNRHSCRYPGNAISLKHETEAADVAPKQPLFVAIVEKLSGTRNVCNGLVLAGLLTERDDIYHVDRLRALNKLKTGKY